jgi:metal-responsive CopG/Arc/MetJ family transcriptional regulator
MSRDVRAQRVTVTLPADVLAFVEKDRRMQDLSRSEYISRALAEVIRNRREQALVERFRQAYADQPQTVAEAEFAEAAAHALGEVMAEDQHRP